MKQENINVERERDTPKPPRYCAQTLTPSSKNGFCVSLCVCMAATTAARATIGNTDPVTSAFA